MLKLYLSRTTRQNPIKCRVPDACSLRKGDKQCEEEECNPPFRYSRPSTTLPRSLRRASRTWSDRLIERFGGGEARIGRKRSDIPPRAMLMSIRPVLKIKVVRPFYRLKYSYVIRSMNPTPRSCLLLFCSFHPLIHDASSSTQISPQAQEAPKEEGSLRNRNRKAMLFHFWTMKILVHYL